MSVAGALGPTHDAQFDAEPVDDEGVPDAHALVGELGGHHHAVGRRTGEAVALGDRGGQEGAGFDAEGGEIDLGATIRRAAGDGDAQRSRLRARVRAPGGGGLLVEEAAGELVGFGVRGERTALLLQGIVNAATTAIENGDDPVAVTDRAVRMAVTAITGVTPER
ncbi:hypothetical protein [Streptomyces sp. NBC_00184]|uniref:hypothetical protein n=1 Tax=Streptomyces sp. NBC_00184 TaxID=2975673 RepID=UPI002E2C88BD|nr:hypothetical protein [Streptomyces sp. NBC_00184]